MDKGIKTMNNIGTNINLKTECGSGYDMHNFMVNNWNINNQFRCVICDKLLAKINSGGTVAGQIKCPRCHSINEK